MSTLRLVVEICLGVTTIYALIRTVIGIIQVIDHWVKKVKDADEKAASDIKELREHTEKEFKAIKEENTLICYGLSACLDGLIQKGCNHTVPLAKDKLDKHLNIKAHE